VRYDDPDERIAFGSGRTCWTWKELEAGLELLDLVGEDGIRAALDNAHIAKIVKEEDARHVYGVGLQGEKASD